MQLPGFKEKSAKKTIDAISKSKEKPFDRVLFALGIRYVGNTVAKRITEAFSDIDSLIAASAGELMSAQDIGEKIASSVYNFLHNEKNIHLVEELRTAGLRMKREERINRSTSLEGKSFVVSGVFENIGRDELKEFIASHGGKVTGSISSKTDFVVAGANMGPAKLEKANSLGVKIISFDDLNGMISD